MKLEEMQAALDSEARKKAARLERDNKHLVIAIRKKQERIDWLENSLRAMYACRNTPNLTSCDKCAARYDCERLEKEQEGAKRE